MIVEYQTFPVEYYTEGPALENNGDVYCTTLTGGKILKVDKEGIMKPWGHTECPNGQVILSNGDHLVCDSSLGSILRFDHNGIFLRNEIERTCSGVKIYVPNDLIVDQDGGIYFTDSVRYEGKVCYRSHNSAEYIVATGLDYPNGLALSPDEKVLFVAESYKNRILAFKLRRPGEADKRFEVFAELPVHDSGKPEGNLPDGIALDNRNNLWVAHYGMQAIQIINMKGELVDSIRMPFPLVSNLYFSGTTHSEVIVTGGFNEPGPGAICRLTIKNTDDV